MDGQEAPPVAAAAPVDPAAAPPVTTTDPAAAPVDPVVPADDENTELSETQRLQARIAELEGEQTKETPEQKLARLEQENLALTQRIAQPAGTVAGNQFGPPITDPAIDLAAIEPGVKWGIRNGLIDPAQFGDHIVEAFKKGELL